MMMTTTQVHAHNTVFSTHLLMSEGGSRGTAGLKNERDTN